MEDFSGVVSEMAQIAKAESGDCDVQRGALERYVEENASRLSSLGEELRDSEERTSEEDKQRVAASFRALERALEPCPANGAVVWGAIEGPMGIAIERP